MFLDARAKLNLTALETGFASDWLACCAPASHGISIRTPIDSNNRFKLTFHPQIFLPP
jgi:hypothetical protein